MNTFPFVVVLSEDTILVDLLGQLLTQDRFLFRGVATAEAVFGLCDQPGGAPAAILVDTIESADEARQLLGQASDRLPGCRPAMLLLTGSTTAEDVRTHPRVDGLLTVPVSADGLVELVGVHARVPRSAIIAAPDAQHGISTTPPAPRVAEPATEASVSEGRVSGIQRRLEAHQNDGPVSDQAVHPSAAKAG